MSGCTPFVTGLALAWFGAVLSDALLAGDDPAISLELESGVVTDAPRKGGYGRELTFTPKGGSPEMLLPSRTGPDPYDFHWTLEAGSCDGKHLALCRGNAGGGLEIWRFTKGSTGWILDARGKFKISIRSRGARFIAINKLEVRQEGGPSDIYEMTDEPRGHDRVYKRMLMNGMQHSTSGTWADDDRSREPRAK